MKTQILSMGIVLSVFVATSNNAFAQLTNNPNLPDSCSTSLLLAGVAGGLGLLCKFRRKP